MDHPKKRLSIRATLTESEVARGQRYYSNADINCILRTFKTRLELDQDEFARWLEIAALLFVGCAAAGKHKPPSELERIWTFRAGRVDSVLSDFDRMIGKELADLESAAQQLVQRTGELPDLGPVKFELPPVPGAEPSPSDYTLDWPVEAQIGKSVASLRWLHQCLLEAASRAAEEKAQPGNRPIEPKHQFFRDLIDLYGEMAAAPCEPRKDWQNRKYHGEVIDFLEACLRPLSVTDSREVIYDTYCRVVEDSHSTGARTTRSNTTV